MGKPPISMAMEKGPRFKDSLRNWNGCLNYVEKRVFFGSAGFNLRLLPSEPRKGIRLRNLITPPLEYALTYHLYTLDSIKIRVLFSFYCCLFTFFCFSSYFPTTIQGALVLRWNSLNPDGVVFCFGACVRIDLGP